MGDPLFWHRFQFGTNWGRFSQVAGGVIGQTLALEGLFAFFLESSFLAMLVVMGITVLIGAIPVPTVTSRQGAGARPA